MKCEFSGSIVALPTPFRDDRLDLDAFRGLIEQHVLAATSGIVVCGTTGESCTLTDGERKTMIASAVRFAAGRLTVIAGVGSNSTRDTVELARFAEQTGVDGLLVVTPYYNKPSPAGLALHFGAIAAAVQIPIILYNVPSRTGLDLEPRLVRKLAGRHENIAGIKEVTSSDARISELCAIDGLAVFCGEDSALVEFAAAGAAGAIGVIANLAPDEVATLLRVGAQNPAKARSIHEGLAHLLRGLYLETNPVPLKAALAKLGRCSSEVRAPLAPLTAEHARELELLLAPRDPAQESAFSAR